MKEFVCQKTDFYFKGITLIEVKVGNDNLGVTIKIILWFVKYNL